MINVIHGDLLDQKGIIVHGCNAMGVMGSGVAAVVKARFPSAYEMYKEYCEENDEAGNEAEKILGDVIVYDDFSAGVIIANGITQAGFGYKKRHVDYEAVAQVFRTVNDMALETKLPVYFPLIGAGLGGGNWKIIKLIIEDELDSSVSATLVLLPGTVEP